MLVAAFRGVRDPVPSRQADGIPWERVARRLSTFPEPADPADKLSFPAWSPANYTPARRRSDNVVGLSAVVLDYDTGTVDLDEASAAFAGITHLGHTTFNHRPDAPRFRLVFPLSGWVAPDAFKKLWPMAMERAGWLPDRACKDVGRAWILPFRGASEPGVIHHEGMPLDCWAQTVPVASGDWDDWQELTLDPDEQDRLARLREAVRTERDWREAAAMLVGAEVVSGSARKAPCPKCQRRSVWWPLSPVRVSLAMCAHRNSCNWMGSIDSVVGSWSAGRTK